MEEFDDDGLKEFCFIHQKSSFVKRQVTAAEYVARDRYALVTSGRVNKKGHIEHHSNHRRFTTEERSQKENATEWSPYTNPQPPQKPLPWASGKTRLQLFIHTAVKK